MVGMILLLEILKKCLEPSPKNKVCFGHVFGTGCRLSSPSRTLPLDGTVQHYGISADSLGLWLQKEYPEIVNSTRVFQRERVLVTQGTHHFYEEAIVMVDPSFLEMFSFYPAFLLSGFEPAKVLKGRLGSGKLSPSFRRILVIFQFTLSIALICGTIVVSRQIHFMRNRKLGFDKNRIIYASVKNLASQRIGAFKEAVSNHSRVTAVTVVSEIPTQIDRTTDALNWEGKKEDDNILMRMFRVDYNTCDVFRYFTL